MNKEDLKKIVFKKIDDEKESSINLLKSLVRLPSPTGSATLAQELVNEKLRAMRFKIDMFGGNTAGIESLDDYCPMPEGENIDENAYNLVGVKDGKGNGKSLMLFSHIDTEIPEKNIQGRNVYKGETKEGCFYGLGAADAKSGIATMLLAAEYVLREAPELDGSLLLMSILGKKGGSAGTLTAIAKGYKADAGIYVHPAETGHGFNEIKCYSMGTIDFKVKIIGKEGAPVDELDDSEQNAIIKGSKVIDALTEWDRQRRKRLVFADGEFKGKPNTKLNIGLARGGIYVGKDALDFEVQCRLYFGVGETIPSVMKELDNFLKQYFKDDEWLIQNPPEIEYMYIRATPASLDRNAEIIKTVESNIGTVTGDTRFIYQYHGASDIRLPNLYGNTPTIGIGPKCGGLYGYEWTDWVDIDDYINGIKIVAATIIDWCII